MSWEDVHACTDCTLAANNIMSWEAVHECTDCTLAAWNCQQSLNFFF